MSHLILLRRRERHYNNVVHYRHSSFNSTTITIHSFSLFGVNVLWWIWMVLFYSRKVFNLWNFKWRKTTFFFKWPKNYMNKNKPINCTTAMCHLSYFRERKGELKNTVEEMIFFKIYIYTKTISKRNFELKSLSSFDNKSLKGYQIYYFISA